MVFGEQWGGKGYDRALVLLAFSRLKGVRVMMWPYGYGGSWGWMGAGWIAMLAFWVVVIVGAVVAIRWMSARSNTGQGSRSSARAKGIPRLGIEEELGARDLDRARRLATGVAAGAFLILGLSALPADAQPGAVAGPKDALTLVRQALAALEVAPPAVSVATGKVIQALLAKDTAGVDMARVQEAAQALGQQDSATAVARLIAALHPARAGSGGVDVALLMPVEPRFAGTPASYALLAGAALLAAVGGLIIRR